MNLSDKELDRLSREAANQHDPGDLVGPRSWDRLEFRLDKELGRLSPSPLRGIRGIRRLPFYYAPAILLLIGVSYYFVKHGKGNAAKTESSGGPPMTLVKPLSPDPNNPNPSAKTLENSQNSTSKPDKELSAEYPAPTPATGSNPIAGATPSADAATASGNTASSNTGSNKGSNTDNASKPSNGLPAAHHPAVVPPIHNTLPGLVSPDKGSPTTVTTTPEHHPGSTTAPGENPITGSTANAAPGSIPTSGKKATGLSPSSHKAPTVPENNATEAGANGANGSTTSHAATVTSHGAGTSHRPNGISPTNDLSRANKPSGANSPIGTNDLSGANGHVGANSTPHRPGRIAPGAAGRNHGRNTPSGTHPGEDGYAAVDPLAPASNNPDNLKTTGQQPGTITPREAAPSLIQAPQSLARSGGIDDASLRAFAAKGAPVATPIRLGKKKDGSLHIDRPLTIGLSVAPDFASVHSVAGDRPGRSFGLTVDYQILDKLYISTGLLLTRKNYTSNPNNYHAPDDYYRPASQHKIDLIKGSFDMLEVPLNLRYDFRANSSTVFFVSGGASSYLLTSEHSQYYFDFFGRQECQTFDPRLESKSRNYLFSAVNLSMGVETGLSNSLSLLVAPYVKIPTRGMGMGQVQITSIGLNFSLRYSPVLSRKRK